MKITKELFDKTYVENCFNLDSINGYNIYSRMLSIMTGKISFLKRFDVSISNFTCLYEKSNHLSDKHKEKLKEFINNLKEKYQLISVSRLDVFSTSKVEEYLYLGDSIIFIVRNNTLIEGIAYNEETLETTIELINEYNELVSPIINELKSIKRFIYLLEIDNRGNVCQTCINTKLSNVQVDRIYNQDLKNNKILSLMKDNDKGGFFIFHGKPGCGKSTYIKYLMETLSKDNIIFYIVSQEIILGYPQQFRKFVIDSAISEEHCVFILEDCEKIITSRDKAGGNNSIVLSELLNISDGILGDFLKAKFICTFNTDLTNIDKALLRKGRLLMKYEFKPLYGEKLYNLAKDLKIENLEKKEMSLAEIFNHNEDNGFTNEERKRIGF